MTPATLHRRWRRRLKCLLDELPAQVRQCRAQGNAADIHQLRVTLRRIRLLLRVGKPLVASATATRFREWAKSVARVTGRVRDLDVAIEWLAAKPGNAELVDAITHRRERGWRTAQPQLRALPEETLLGLREVSRGKRAAARLERRCAKTAGRLRTAVRAELFFFERLLPEARHEFRRALRWWRYLRELSLSRRRHKGDKLLVRLIGAQEAIGELQNGDLTRAALERLKPSVTVLAMRRLLARERATRSTEIRGNLASLAKWLEWQPTTSVGSATESSAKTKRAVTRSL